MNVALAQPPSFSDARSSRQNLIALLLATAAIGTLWFILCRFLSNEWAINEQYNYGWFVPFFCAYLFWLRWEDRPQPETAAEAPNPKSQVPIQRNLICALVAIVTLFFLLPIRFFGIAAPDWRPVAWLHAVAVVVLTLIGIWVVGGKSWLRHFAFPIAFIFVAVPWIAGIEVAVVQGLMRIVAAIAAETLKLVGIPAQLEGNLIRVRTGLVGVNEACSGVRSLQTSIMIGLLFGELRRLNFARRIVLLIAAAFIAFAANLFRAFFLVWIAAHNGIDATSKWHDWTGYSIVICVFAGSLAVAAVLARGQPKMTKDSSRHRASDPSAHQTTRFQLSASPFLRIPVLASILIWLLLIEASADTWYRSHESKMLARVGWSVHWPETAPQFRNLPLDEKVRRVLRFDEGRGALWSFGSETISSNVGRHLSEEKGSAPITCVLYFFRWQSGRSSILRARGHRPDICLPASGWVQTSDEGSRTYLVNKIVLPFRHFEFERHSTAMQSPQFAHAFFTVQEDLIAPNSESFSRAEDLNTLQGFGLIPHLWRLVREGERPHGQQVMQVVFLSAQSLPTDEAEEKFRELVSRIIEIRK